MENKILITTYGDFKLVLDAEVLENNEYIKEDFFNDYDFTACGSWERVEYEAVDSLNEYIDGLVPIYCNKIDEDFNDLTDWRVDDLIKNYFIEYRGDFSRFKQEVLYYDMYEVAYNELTEAIENMEEEEIEE